VVWLISQCYTLVRGRFTSSMIQEPPSSRGWAAGGVRFSGFEVDFRNGEIRKNGSRIRLQDQPFRILQILLEHPGELVTREELQRQIWPADTFVDFEKGLNNAIKRLRDALGDSAEQPRFIETHPKRGYRFIGSATAIEGTVRAEAVANGKAVTLTRVPAPYRQLAIGTILFLAFVVIFFGLDVGGLRQRLWVKGDSPVIHSLAVIPLANLSNDPNQEYFSDGMTDALITDLAQIGSLKVISRTSSMQYKQSKKSLPEIARELNVDGIIEGTVQHSGDRVRITAQLIYGPADKHLWANSYERDIRDVFGLERTVTEDIGRQIQAHLATEKQPTLAQPRPVNPEALEAYLQGNYRLNGFGKGSGDDEKKNAGEYFQHAIDVDPNFVPAYKGLADSHSDLMWPSSQDAGIVTKATKRALELDPNSADARVKLGDIKFSRDWDFSGAEEEYRRAMALSPNNANVHTTLCIFLYAMERRDEAGRECQISQELDPTGDHRRDVDALYWAGKDDRAIQFAQTLLKTDPNDGFLHHALYRYYARKGMYKEASQEAETTLALFGDLDGALHVQNALVASGDRAALRQVARELEHWISTAQGYFPVNVAAVCAILDDKDRAFYWLEDAYKHHDRAWLTTDMSLESLKSERMFDSLRSDPRFKDLVRRVGLPP